MVDTETSIEEMRRILIDYEIATEDEIDLVTNINGYKTGSFEDILYARTGYEDFNQWLEDICL